MTNPPRDHRWPRTVFGVGEEPDVRFTMANERTFLAWIRTALGFLAAGVAVIAVARFGAALRVEIRVAAMLLIVAGLCCAVGAFLRWARVERAIRLRQPLPSSVVMPLAAVVLVVVALGAAVLAGVM